ncbi:hypothetical protein QWE_01570 [Agrobacterium albertimagni AOL15]|uniref:Uncharacterized protein n=1 Tax=Agrobacterium albertimagni AOL15 TaxID=1156935 RepID=K2R048_9HYPH|nr:hypothetical protein QWE_01570 [Agrobacterium albertimagni AOL15]
MGKAIAAFAHLTRKGECFWRLVGSSGLTRGQASPEREGAIPTGGEAWVFDIDISPHPEVPDIVGPRRARPQLLKNKRGASRPAILAGTSA